MVTLSFPAEPDRFLRHGIPDYMLSNLVADAHVALRHALVKVHLFCFEHFPRCVSAGRLRFELPLPRYVSMATHRALIPG